MQLIKTVLNAFPRPWLIRASYWVRPLLVYYYKGNAYTDPIDGRSFRTFLPYGYGKVRENVLSPSTLSLERHRLLWLYLQRKTDFFKASLRVLHIAPEQAFYRKFKEQTNLQYITSDLYSPLADVKADICDLPFEDEQFDVIFCNHVLEHIPDDAQAMRELYRVLSKGGWGIFQVPQELERAETFSDDTITDPKERARIFGQYDHVRIYGKDYFDKLRSIGFEVIPTPCREIASEEEIKKYRLVAEEILPIVRK